MDRAHLLRDLGAILRDVAVREILPRFRALAASEVHSKAFDGVKPTLVAPTEAIWHRACEELFGAR